MIRLALCVLLVGLAGCVSFPLSPSEYRDALDRAPYTQRKLSEAWVTAPGAELLLERSYRATREQRILLENRTSMPGDNFILLRSDRGRLSTAGRFDPDALIALEGGTPDPFDPLDELTLRTETDALGALSWAQWTNGADIHCVLAFRRLGAGSRSVPVGSAGMDMMVRNCIRGTVEDALMPAKPGAAGYPAGAGRTGGAPQMLSPLAAPLP